MESKTTPITKRLRVLSVTFANLPTSGNYTEDLAWTTDRKTWFRWSGSAWVEISIPIRVDVIANLGTATDYPPASVFFATDTLGLYVNNAAGTAWIDANQTAESGAAASLPTATDRHAGSLYYETDTGICRMVDTAGTAWIICGGISREFNVPFDSHFRSGYALGGQVTYGACYYSGTQGHYVNFMFEIPEDFTSLVSCELICVADNDITGVNALDFKATYGNEGEATTNHAETAIGGNQTIGHGLVYHQAITVLSSLAANDMVGLQILNAAGMPGLLRILGLKIRYI